MRQLSWMLATMMTAVMVVLTGVTFAGDNTNLPFTDDFESYTNLTPLIDGTNGWYSSSYSIDGTNWVSVVQTNEVGAEGGAQAAMIPVDCTLSNRFTNIPAPNICWIQMDVRPSLYDATNCPEVDTNAAWMFYVNSNGYFVVHDGPVTNGNPTNSSSWLTQTNTPVASNTWVRINIYENFTQTNWDLYADGVLVTNNIGFINTNATNFMSFDLYSGATTSYLDNVFVAATDTNQLIMFPSTLSAIAFAGRTPHDQTVQVYNVWTDEIGFAITNNQAWVLASPSNGVVPAKTTTNITLTYIGISNWLAGAVSNATVTLVSTNGSGDARGTQTVALTMSITDLQVTPTNITNTVAIGSTPTNRSFNVINAGAGAFDYTATITNDWLSFSGLSETSGTVNAHSTNTLTLTYSNTAGWIAGATNNATVTIASGDGGGAEKTVNVALIMTATLQTSTSRLTNTVMQGGWTSMSFEVWTTNDGVVNYSVATSHYWIVLGRSSGSLTGRTDGATNTIVVAFTNTAELTIWDHEGLITISAPGCADVAMDVVLTVQAAPMLKVSPASITNSVMEGQNAASQDLRVWNGSAYYGIGYQVTTNVSWLSVQVTNDYLAELTTNRLTITYAVTNLTSAGGDVPSNYFGEITVTATNADGSQAAGSPFIIPVTIRVNPKSSMALSLTNLSQTVLQGQDAASQSFDVWNANGFYTLDYVIAKTNAYNSSERIAWLIPTPTNGTSTGQYERIVVQYSTANLPVGNTNALITVVGRAWDGVHAPCAVETQTIAVALSVTPFATLATDAKPDYAYIVRKGRLTPPPDTEFDIWNGGAPPNSMYFTVSPSVSWLSVTPASGTSTGTSDKVGVSAQIDSSAMTPGVVYSGKVTIDATDAASGKTAYESPFAFTISVVLREFKGFDFQGGLSGASDIVLYREANGAWEIRNLLSEYATTQYLGGVGYQAVPGDYTGDGITEMGVYRTASGSWYAQSVDENAQCIEIQQWAGTGYVGMPGDYDGDGLTDPGVYLEESGLWMLLMSGNDYRQVSGIFGGPGYTALHAGDYDGDCKTDPGVYHRASGLWVLLFSTSGSLVSGIFGGEGFVPVPTDYDGDGITDPAVYATESGYWYILPSDTSANQGEGVWIRQFGGTAMSATLVSAPGNYDGVGGADLGLYDTAVWRWYIVTLDGVPLAWDYPMGRLGCLPVRP